MKILISILIIVFIAICSSEDYCPSGQSAFINPLSDFSKVCEKNVFPFCISHLIRQQPNAVTLFTQIGYDNDCFKIIHVSSYLPFGCHMKSECGRVLYQVLKDPWFGLQTVLCVGANAFTLESENVSLTTYSLPKFGEANCDAFYSSDYFYIANASDGWFLLSKYCVEKGQALNQSTLLVKEFRVTDDELTVIFDRPEPSSRVCPPRTLYKDLYTLLEQAPVVVYVNKDHHPECRGDCRPILTTTDDCPTVGPTEVYLVKRGTHGDSHAKYDWQKKLMIVCLTPPPEPGSDSTSFVVHVDDIRASLLDLIVGVLQSIMVGIFKFLGYVLVNIFDILFPLFLPIWEQLIGGLLTLLAMLHLVEFIVLVPILYMWQRDWAMVVIISVCLYCLSYFLNNYVF